MQKPSYEPKPRIDRIGLHQAYMELAHVWAQRSKAVRRQVGAILVKDGQIISDGYNGMPAGTPQENEACEEWQFQDGQWVMATKPDVLHAEANAILKMAANGGTGTAGATLYVTLSPCRECAKLIKQAKITKVFYREPYRILDGVRDLDQSGIPCLKL